ncbi:Uncharacterized protein APZ42_026710 [Daphnia magna]|uniref:Uncharacterized protein n=1 Tax=Daphnia magna TaxID=35525 RepID=A0A164S149_9CRUS|nr:Uncharacterized protein APZ42_026710 [Daphnia magna]
MRSKSQVSRKKLKENQGCCCPAKKIKFYRRPDGEISGDRNTAFDEGEEKLKVEWMKIHLPEQGSNETTVKEHMASTLFPLMEPVEFSRNVTVVSSLVFDPDDQIRKG